MKKRIKVFVLSITIFMLLFTYTNVFGSGCEEAVNNLSLSEDMDFKSWKERVDNYANQIWNSKAGTTVMLDIDNETQTTNYYCGVACSVMALNYLTSGGYTQSGIASDMGLTSGTGATVYQIYSVLNSKLGSNTYKYTTHSQITFGNGLVYSLGGNKPVICRVNMAGLPNYPDSHFGGHYVLVRGYYVAAGGTSYTANCYYNDPHNNSSYGGQYSCSFDTMIYAMSALNDNTAYYIMRY